MRKAQYLATVEYAATNGASRVKIILGGIDVTPSAPGAKRKVNCWPGKYWLYWYFEGPEQSSVKISIAVEGYKPIVVPDADTKIPIGSTIHTNDGYRKIAIPGEPQ